MQSVDITSGKLAEYGFALKKEDFSVVVINNESGFQWRFTIYPKDWNKTTRAVENKLEDAAVLNETIQLIIKDMSANYGDVIGNGKGKSSSSSSSSTKGPKMAPKAI